ncbi:hypothetical protein GQ43DRAFT_372101 [Delitschia confertaspora ATCC 74209]|uniref:DUF952 domain-containing protein n=1 Tax=Delitschia confertaspora ATCC 74209 TaxID=1513339 RepID=A0A9P4JRA6_9PLEO|nr:hypothetical protein GQ43DRAFT_372101 [Delitschia confertaspora ATCC 74209]
MPPPNPPPTHLYKILPSAPPSPLPERLPLSDLDKNDGYIHLSTADQVASTADKWFANFETLWLLKIRLEDITKIRGFGGVPGGNAEIKWEEVGRGCFAHLYGGDLGASNVAEVLEIKRVGEQRWEAIIQLEN